MAELKTIDPRRVARIVGRYVAHNKIGAAELPDLIATVHRTLAELGQPAEISRPLTPAVAINRSYGRDFVVCLECGWRGKMLRSHLRAAHGLTPRDYRSRWHLRDTHPLIASTYSERRASLAKEFGLGRARQTSTATAEPGTPPPKRGRPRRYRNPAPRNPLTGI